jgi:hypothetical protein
MISGLQIKVLSISRIPSWLKEFGIQENKPIPDLFRDSRIKRAKIVVYKNVLKMER